MTSTAPRAATAEQAAATTGSGLAPLGGVRLCVVGINYAPEVTGIGPYTTAMARAWAQAGAEVTMITGVPHYPQWCVIDERYRRGSRWVERDGAVRVVRLRHHVPAGAGLAGRARMESSFFRRAAMELRATSADAIVAVTPSLSAAGAALAARRKRPLGVVVQDLTGRGAAETGSTRASVARAIGALEYAALRRADAVGVIAPEFGTVLGEHGVDGQRVLDSANFARVTPSPLGVREAQQQLGWSPGPFRVIHTGNMGTKQGLEGVVDAAAEAVRRQLDVEFVLVGDGNSRAALAERAANLPNLRLVAPVDDATYPVVLAAADVLLVHERPGVQEMCLPSKLTSYAAAGRPILAAVNPRGITARELEEHHAAESVCAGDSSALLDAIEALQRSPQLRAARARAALDYGERVHGRAAAERRYLDLALRLVGPHLPVQDAR